MPFFSKPYKDIVMEESEFENSFEEKNIKETSQKTKPSQQQAKTSTKKDEVAVLNVENSSDWLKAKGQLVVDVYQTDDDFCIIAPVAGVEPQDISVGIERQMLVIKGERKDPDENQRRQYTYHECFFGPFARQIILPDYVDTNNIKSTLKKGILLIKIPKNQKDKKQIKITVEE